MSTPQVHDLLKRWKELRDRGKPISSEELCRDCPGLLSEVRRLLDEPGPGGERPGVERGTTPQESDNAGLERDLIVEDAGERTKREEAETLRARLRLAVVVWLAHWLIYSTLLLHYRFPAPYSAVLEVTVLVMMAVVLGRRKGKWSLSSLRWLEFLVFAAIVQRNLIGQGVTFGKDLLAVLNSDEPLIAHASNIAAPWVEVIIVYGLLIPNRWQRCARVVIALAISPLALLAGAAHHFDVLGHPMVVGTLEVAGLRVAFAAAIAILGSYGMQMLRREVRQARELGQYSLQQRLGQGGMAEVYLAEHRLLRRLCAIKLIRAENADDPHAQRRFAREVRAMTRIRHPHIVEIFDYGVSAEGKFYYVMEYLTGHNLEELVHRHGPLPPGRVVYLLRHIMSALEAMHGQGVIHRDIKPSNIFLSAPDVVKVFDFGLVHVEAGVLTAADAGKLTRDNRVVGTPAYMAPEQIDLTRPIDARSDLYAVGLVTYFLLAGGNPFARDEVRKIFAAHMHEEAPPLREVVPGVPADLAGIVHRCLAKNPDDRYPDAASMREAVESCCSAQDWNAARADAWWREVAAVSVVSLIPLGTAATDRGVAGGSHVNLPKVKPVGLALRIGHHDAPIGRPALKRSVRANNACAGFELLTQRETDRFIRLRSQRKDHHVGRPAVFVARVIRLHADQCLQASLANVLACPFNRSRLGIHAKSAGLEAAGGADEHLAIAAAEVKDEVPGSHLGELQQTGNDLVRQFTGTGGSRRRHGGP
jgi:tRNA A-37 threonylcarbamoyl transferase component Bud32